MTELESIIKVQKDKILDTSNYTESDGYARVGRVISPVAIVGLDSDGNLVSPGIIDTDGRVRVNPTDESILFEETTASASTASITIPAGERWEILQVQADAKMDANVADRVLTVTISMAGMSPGIVVLALVSSSTITLSQSQFGGFFFPMGNNPNHWTNDNGTVAKVADENPMPIIVEATTILSLSSDNDQVADKMSIGVWYRKIV